VRFTELSVQIGFASAAITREANNVAFSDV
jgi:hypothetical protein